MPVMMFPNSPESKTATVQASSARTVAMLVFRLEKTGKRRLSSGAGRVRSTAGSWMVMSRFPSGAQGEEGIRDPVEGEPADALRDRQVGHQPLGQERHP